MVIARNLALKAPAVFYGFIRSRLTYVGLLFFLGVAPATQASCLDLLRVDPGKFSEKIYTESLADQNFRPHMLGLLPEELLAVLGKSAPSLDLLALLKNEFSVESLRFGPRFRLASWPYRTLTLERPPDLHSENLAAYTLEFSRFLFESKRRSLRFVVNPVRYLASLERVTAGLETLVYPALEVLHPGTGVAERQRLGAFRLGLRSILLISPGKSQLWPLTGGNSEERLSLNRRRQSLHWGLSRTVAALYLSTLAMSLSELPDALKSFELLYKMRGDLIELGQEMSKGTTYDRRFERERLIAKYELRIQQLEAKITAGGDSIQPQALKDQIADLTSAILSMRAELESMN